MKFSRGDQFAWRPLPARAALLIVWLAVCGAATAQTTRPAPGIYENQTIRRGAVTSSAATTQDAAARSSDFLDLRRVGAALAMVLGLIFFLRWVGRRFFPAMTGGRANDVVRVLSRSPLTPKQHVLLVQVGRRVLVVVDNGTQMSPLSEITDADEIAQLVSQVSGGRAAKEAFGASFGKAQESFADAAALAPTNVDMSADIELSADESLAGARGEIDGLMQKVRGLAKQLGRG